MKFRMIDRIIDYAPAKSIRGIKTVSFEEYQLKSAFDSNPCLPESLIMESFFQLGNWLIMLTSNFLQMGLLVRTNEVSFEGTAGPGENMLMDIHVCSYRDDGVLFDGRAFVNGNVIAKGTGCLASLVQIDDFYNPDDLKVLFSEIHRLGFIGER